MVEEKGKGASERKARDVGSGGAHGGVAKGGGGAATQVATATREAPKAKPARPAEKPGAGPEVTRRGFVSVLGLAWFAFAASIGAGLSAMLRFFFPNVLYEPPTVFKVGFPDEYNVGQVVTKFKEKYQIWLVRDERGFFALLAICTHLGCTPNWLEAEGKFKCPCHGSGFRMSGINFEGPAPRPLERVAIHRSDDGQLEVDKSRKFQYEKGQWSDPASYVPFVA